MRRAGHVAAALVCWPWLATVAVAGSLAGWQQPGANPPAYEIRVDDVEPYRGSFSASISCASCPHEPPATLMQTVRAESYRGQRLRLAGYLRSLDVRQWAGLWMRVDGAQRSAVAFDNMSRRSVQGTTAWTRYEVVLDVPDDAVQIAFGILLAGEGRLWADELSLRAVDRSVAPTDLGYSPEYGAVELGEDVPTGPRNLSFED